jgi:hypothetical protein
MKNDELEKIRNLPMLLPDARLVEAVDSVLDIAREPSVSATDVAELLVDLVFRQSSNYRPFDAAIYERIDDWVIRSWRDDSPELFDALSTLVLNCNSVRGFELLRQASASPSEEIRSIAADALAEARADGQIE